MPSQRELAWHFTESFEQLGQSFCALIKTLEPEDTDATIRSWTRCLNCGYVDMPRMYTEEEIAAGVPTFCLEDTDATIRELRARAHILREERDEAKAELEVWRRRRNAQQSRAERLCKELAEAKAEIERLKVLISDLTAGITMCQADAALGRLVRNMNSYTQLFRGRADYWVEQHSENGTTLWVGDEMTNPAEVLRAIQEVPDDQG